MVNQEMEKPRGKRFSLQRVYDAFGLIRESPKIIPPDISLDAITQKITNPKIAQAMGASPEIVSVIHQAELTANLLDSFSESGERSFLELADQTFQLTVDSLPPQTRELVLDLTKAAMTWFYFESAVATRIKSGDQFLSEEAIEYLLRRGADSAIYAALLQANNISSLGMIAGFRARQALWDLRDDVKDLEQDRESTGANVLLLSTQGDRRTLKRFAVQLLNQGRKIDAPTPLKSAIEEEYELTAAALR